MILVVANKCIIIELSVKYAKTANFDQSFPKLMVVEQPLLFCLTPTLELYEN